MGHWYCPQCHTNLYWRSRQVRSNSWSHEGKCPTCDTRLTIHIPRVLWFLSVIGGLGIFFGTIVDHHLLPNLAERFLALKVTAGTLEMTALALQLPRLLLGPRYGVLPKRPD